MFVQADAKSDLASIDVANKVWLRVLSIISKSKPSKYELVAAGVKKSGYVYKVETRVGTKRVRFTLILRSKSMKQMAAYFGKASVDVIELNCLPKSNITTDSILRSLTETVRGYFVHEFVHYLDARKFKSKKQYEKHVHDIEKQAKRGNVSDREYFNFDLERNTHYSEIVNALRIKMNKSRFNKRVNSFQKFLLEAKKIQKEFFKNLSDVNRKRVVSRLYAMYQLLRGNMTPAKSLIAVGGYVVQASEPKKMAGGGRLITEEELRERGRKRIAAIRKHGLASWEQLQKSNLFPRFQKPPKGYLRACRCGIYITCENGDQWYTDIGIRGYSAMYVTPFDKHPIHMLDDEMKPITFNKIDFGFLAD